MAKLLSSLPVGALVKDTGTTYNGAVPIFRVLEHGHSGDPAGTTALEFRDIISLKCFDAKEPNNSDSNRKSYGNNRYLHSNLLQWLNSDASSWYTAQHNADQAPDSSNVWASSGTPINPYDTEAGFLSNFSTALKNALQTVSKTTAKNTVTDGGGYETVESKIFLLSTTEVGLANENNVAEGSIYAYYSADNTNARRVKVVANAAACGNYTGTSAGSAWNWWLRTPGSGLSINARYVYSDGSRSDNGAYIGNIGVSPAFALLSSLSVTDEPDTDGAYILQFNASPTISAPDSLGDKTGAFNMTWSANDADGDAVSAVIKLDGTTKETIPSVNLGQSYTFTVDNATFRALTAGSHTIQIVATDSNGASTTKNITFQRVLSTVAISGSDGDLGNKWIAPSIVYQVSDTGGTTVTVTEKIDGVTSRQFTATLNTNITFDMSDFSSLSDETQHTVQIVAVNEDSQSATRTYTFTKLYEQLEFYTQPIATDAAAQKINVVVNYDHTGNPTLKVEVTNDANAIQCHWEDATSAVAAGTAYEFQNEPASENDYGVAIRVTLTKSASTERVYLTSFGFSYA